MAPLDIEPLAKEGKEEKLHHPNASFLCLLLLRIPNLKNKKLDSEMKQSRTSSCSKRYKKKLLKQIDF